MKYIKKVSVGSFLKKGEDFKDGTIATIANEGKQIEGQFGTQDIFLIKLENGKEGNVAFNTTTINNLIDTYGDDSIGWIGKKIKVQMVRQNVQGKITPVYYFLHPNSELDDKSGQFVIKKEKERTAEEINSDIQQNLEDMHIFEE